MSNVIISSYEITYITSIWLKGGRTAMTVLIVDDDRDSLEQINQYVRYRGYDTVMVQSGYEALDMLEQLVPYAIILDAVMPELNGLEVIRKIKRKEGTRDIPIILISALGSEIKLMLDPEEQANHYLSRPFSSKDLLKVLNKLINP